MDIFPLRPEIQNSVQEKGFSVYSYISLSELVSTVQRDYLDVLSKINIPFAFSALFFFYLGYEGGNLLIPFLFFLFAYGFIFLFLLLRLIHRTKHYFAVNNVVFTEKKIMFGEKIYAYSEEIFSDVLEFYDEMFEEFLTKPSRIQEVIKNKKRSLTESTIGIFGKAQQLIGKNTNKRDSAGASLFVFIALSLYSVSLFVAYYVGITLGYVFFGIYALILKAASFFVQSVEQRIKKSVEKIDISLQNLQSSERAISRKIISFSDGNIENIAHYIGSKFSYFYTIAHQILLDEKVLKNQIESSKYKSFINFLIFRKYLKKQYNKPIEKLLNMLKKSQSSLEKNWKNLKEQKINQPEFSAHLTQKILRSEEMLVSIRQNIQKLEILIL